MTDEEKANAYTDKLLLPNLAFHIEPFVQEAYLNGLKESRKENKTLYYYLIRGGFARTGTGNGAKTR